MLPGIVDRFRTLLRKRANEQWLALRKRLVIGACLAPTSPLTEKPYIEGGRYQWYVERPVELDFFFPDVPLAIKVAPRYYGPHDAKSVFVCSQAFWEADCEEGAFVIDVCKRAGIPLLFVSPDDPIDLYSIANAITALVG